VLSFIPLALTGIVLFLKPFSAGEMNNWMQVHFVFGVLLTLDAAAFFLVGFDRMLLFIKRIFTFTGNTDLGERLRNLLNWLNGLWYQGIQFQSISIHTPGSHPGKRGAGPITGGAQSDESRRLLFLKMVNCGKEW